MKLNWLNRLNTFPWFPHCRLLHSASEAAAPSPSHPDEAQVVRMWQRCLRGSGCVWRSRQRRETREFSSDCFTSVRQGQKLSPQRSHLGQSCRTNRTQDQKICQRERRAGIRLNWNFPWLLMYSCRKPAVCSDQNLNFRCTQRKP